MTPRILVACVGNIFLGDDAFGVEVAGRLARQPWPEGVRLVDVGIRSVHLVYELMDGYDVLVLVDTVAHQEGPPGSVYLIEPDLAAARGEPAGPLAVLDPHDLGPGGVLDLVPQLGGAVGRVLVVGCQPASLEEGIGLSDAVRDAIAPAAVMVRDIVAREHARLTARIQTPTGGER